MTDLREAIVAVIRENLMSTDHPISEWEEQFADAVLAILPDAEALAGALEPFVECCESIGRDEDDEEWAKFRLLIKDYRRAHDALANYRKGTGREG